MGYWNLSSIFSKKGLFPAYFPVFELVPVFPVYSSIAGHPEITETPMVLNNRQSVGYVHEKSRQLFECTNMIMKGTAGKNFYNVETQDC